MGWSNLWSVTLIFILLSEYISCEKEGRKGIRYTVINYFLVHYFSRIFIHLVKLSLSQRIVFSVDKVETSSENRERSRSYHPAKFAKIWIFVLCTFKNSNFHKFCWVIRTQPISVLNYFYFTKKYQGKWFFSLECF